MHACMYVIYQTEGPENFALKVLTVQIEATGQRPYSQEWGHSFPSMDR